jgi:hypothetical protein
MFGACAALGLGIKIKLLVCCQGNLVPKASTFPSGIKALADYIHGKGLKLGIYSDAGYIYSLSHIIIR